MNEINIWLKGITGVLSQPERRTSETFAHVFHERVENNFLNAHLYCNSYIKYLGGQINVPHTGKGVGVVGGEW